MPSKGNLFFFVRFPILYISLSVYIHIALVWRTPSPFILFFICWWSRIAQVLHEYIIDVYIPPSFSLSNEWKIECYSSPSICSYVIISESIQSSVEIAEKLPPTEKNLFGWLVDLLVETANLFSFNKMTPHNLGNIHISILPSSFQLLSSYLLTSFFLYIFLLISYSTAIVVGPQMIDPVMEDPLESIISIGKANTILKLNVQFFLQKKYGVDMSGKAVIFLFWIYLLSVISMYS